MELEHKLILITTKGCEGCRIAKNILTEVYKLYLGEYTFTTYDKDEYLKLPDRECVDDFPTVLFYIGDDLFRKVVGTRSKGIFRQYIDKWLETKGTHKNK